MRVDQKYDEVPSWCMFGNAIFDAMFSWFLLEAEVLGAPVIEARLPRVCDLDSSSAVGATHVEGP